MTTKKPARNGSMSTAQKVSIGVGLTATAIAAVGGYFFYGSKDSVKNRKLAKSWMLKAKADVLDGLERAKQMTEEEYDALVTNVARGYKTAKKASATELVAFVQNMHQYWKDIERAGTKKVIKKKAPTSAKASQTPKKKAPQSMSKNQ